MKRAVGFYLLLMGTHAAGYVLPGGAILRRMAETRNDTPLTTLKVQGAMTFFGPAVMPAGAALGVPAERSELTSDGAVYLKVPGRCRMEASVAEGNKVAVVQAGGRKKLEGTEIPALTVAIEQVCALLATRASTDMETRAQVERHLRALGVDPRTTSLSRLGSEVVYVLGDPADGQPQFWVYKESFRPARIRFSDATGTAWDVRFVDYTSSAAGEGMPRNVEVWRGGERVLRFAAFKGDTRSALPDALFAR